MTAISVAVVWLVVGFVVAVLFGTAIRRAHREHDDEPALDRRSGEIRYLRRRRNRKGADVEERKLATKRHAAA